MGLSDKARAQLRKVSTAALTTVLFKRGLRNAYIQGISPLKSGCAANWSAGLHCATSRRARISM